jgi:cystathionine beta-lyase/cystathionine gamma-synthase
VRLSVGCEDRDDLVNDIEQALDALVESRTPAMCV